MGTRIGILGGGGAGTMTAIRPCRGYDRHEHRLTVVVQDVRLSRPVH